MKNLFVILCCIFALVGCATAPSPSDEFLANWEKRAEESKVTPPSREQAENANYGTIPDNYKDLAEAYISSRLKDPYSAKYQYGEPFKAYSQDGGLSKSKGRIMFGWSIEVMVNAKNSYGAYTGYQPYYLMFSDGVMYDISENQKYGRSKNINLLK